MTSTEATRTVEQIDQDIAAVESTVAKLRAESQRITDELTLGQEDSVLVEAALSGKSPATSQKTQKLEARREEIGNMLGALASRSLRLRRERTLVKMEEVEERQAAHTKEAEKAQERFDEAQAALREAQDQMYFDSQEAMTLREELRSTEDKLYQIDESFRREEEEEAQRRMEEHRRLKEEVIAQQRKEMAARSGLYILEDESELQALEAAAERQGSRITRLGPRVRGDEQ